MSRTHLVAACIFLAAPSIVSAQELVTDSARSESAEQPLRLPVNHLRQPFTDRTKEVVVSRDQQATARIRYSDWKLEDESFHGVHTKRAEKRAFFQKDTTCLRVTVANRSVDWVGTGTPIVIRESEGTLHLVVFDRETDAAQIRFRFFVERYNGFHEIPANQSPGGIAVQNMWLQQFVIKYKPQPSRFTETP